MRLLIAIPALNEELVIGRNAARVAEFVRKNFPGDEARVVIVDNGSTDRTAEIAAGLAAADPSVRLLRLAERGKGLAIRAAWSSAPADVYVFMDADLATDLEALPRLVREAAESGGIAVGDRYHRDSRIERPFFRRFISAGYRSLARIVLGTRVNDLPCGFKAAAASVVSAVLSQVKNDSWFFDSELVVRAEKAGFPVRGIPIRWREHVETGRRSRVRVARLAWQYWRQIVWLRRELERAAETEDARLERRWFWTIVAIAAAVTAVPPVYAMIQAVRFGAVWNGLSFLSPGDTSYYLAMIRQAREGRFLFDNLFTMEPWPPRLNLAWAAVGWLTFLPGVSPLLAWHAARTALIPVLGAAAMRLFRLVLPSVRERLVALALLLFGSGIGPYVIAFMNAPTELSRAHQWPIDLWVTEASGFLSILNSPHFIVSLTLLLAAFRFFLQAAESGRPRDRLAAGAAGCLLVAVHPFNAPVLYSVPAVWLAWRVASERRVDRRAVAAYAVLAAMSAPPLVYFFFWTLINNASRSFLDSNACPTPYIWFVLAGLGLTAVLWYPGQRILRRRGVLSSRIDFFVIWFIVQLTLIYLPIAFQRRFIEGIQAPLAALAAAVLVVMPRSLLPRWPSAGRAAAAGALFFLLLMPASFLNFIRDVHSYAANDPPIFFFSRAEAGAFRWIRETTPADAAFIAGPAAMNQLPGWTARRVYAGHWAETPDIRHKYAEAQGFFLSWSDAERARFMAARGLDHVFCGLGEKAVGSCPSDPAYFTKEYDRDGIEIIRLSVSP